jgi:hypothetical protein
VFNVGWHQKLEFKMFECFCIMMMMKKKKKNKIGNDLKSRAVKSAVYIHLFKGE